MSDTPRPSTTTRPRRPPHGNPVTPPARPMHRPRLTLVRRLATLRRGAPTSAIILDDVELLLAPSGAPGGWSIGRGPVGGIDGIRGLVAVRDGWTPESESVYVFEGGGCVWVLSTTPGMSTGGAAGGAASNASGGGGGGGVSVSASMTGVGKAELARADGARGSTTLGAGVGHASIVGGAGGRGGMMLELGALGRKQSMAMSEFSPLATFQMEKSAAVDWGKGFSHNRGYKYEYFEDADPVQAAFWEALGVERVLPPSPSPAPSDQSPISSKPDLTKVERPGSAASSEALQQQQQSAATSAVPGQPSPTAQTTSFIRTRPRTADPALRATATPSGNQTCDKTVHRLTDTNIVRCVETVIEAHGRRVRWGANGFSGEPLFKSDGVYFVEAGDSFFVWTGDGVDMKRRPMQLAFEYFYRTGRQMNVPVTGLREGSESDAFLSYFDTEKDEEAGETEGGASAVLMGFPDVLTPGAGKKR
ncbi:hypothetical protein HK101_004594 [Irineochytrium annulatum]|nr:hypothetical protein HK101_004594 [Irineochytrium annulatum]